MRLSKTNLLIIGIVPILFGVIIIYNFWKSIDKLYQVGNVTVHDTYVQLAVIGASMFLGAAAYWSILVYYIYIIQENEILIQDNFTQLAGSGTKHLENAKNLIAQVLDDIKTSDMLKL